MSPDQVQGWLQLGLGGLLLVVLLLGHKRLWVFGWHFTEVKTDRDYWRDVALKSMGHTDKALDAAQKAP